MIFPKFHWNPLNRMDRKSKSNALVSNFESVGTTGLDQVNWNLQRHICLYLHIEFELIILYFINDRWVSLPLTLVNQLGAKSSVCSMYHINELTNSHKIRWSFWNLEDKLTKRYKPTDRHLVGYALSIITCYWHLRARNEETACQFLMYLPTNIYRKNYPSCGSTAQRNFLYMKWSHIQKTHTSDPGPRLFLTARPSIRTPVILTFWQWTFLSLPYYYWPFLLRLPLWVTY